MSDVVSGVVNVRAPSTPRRVRVPRFGLPNSGYSDELRQILSYRPPVINAVSPKTGERITRAQMLEQSRILQWFENAPVWVWEALDRWRTNAGWRAQFRKVLRQLKRQAMRLRIAFYKAPQSVRMSMNSAFLTVQTPADVNPRIPPGARELTRGTRPAAKNTFTALWQAMPGGAKRYHRRKLGRSFIEDVD